jgi:hypothetical protein
MKTMDEAFRIYKFIQQRLPLWNAIELYILLCKIIDQQILQQIRFKKKSLSPQCNNMIKVSWHFTELGWQPKKLNLAACSAVMTWRPVCKCTEPHGWGFKSRRDNTVTKRHAKCKAPSQYRVSTSESTLPINATQAYASPVLPSSSTPIDI